MLGIPKKEDVFYMGRELYEKVVKSINTRDYSEDEFPLIKELLKNLSKNEEMILVSLLVFNPNKRPRCDYLLEYPFFKAYTPKNQRSSPEESQKSEEINQIRSLINNSSPVDYQTKKVDSYEKGMYSQKKGTGSVEKNKNSEQGNNWWNTDLNPLEPTPCETESRVLRPFSINENQQKPPFPILAKNSSKKTLNKFDTPKNPQKTSLINNENQENEPSVYRKSATKKEGNKNVQSFSPYNNYNQNYNGVPTSSFIHQVTSSLYLK